MSCNSQEWRCTRYLFKSTTQAEARLVMARIAGVNIPQNKVVHVALTYIHGIGKKYSHNICSKLEIAKNKACKKRTKK